MCVIKTHTDFLALRNHRQKDKNVNGLIAIYFKRKHNKNTVDFFLRGFFSCLQLIKYNFYHLHLDRGSSLPHKENSGQ